MQGKLLYPAGYYRRKDPTRFT